MRDDVEPDTAIAESFNDLMSHVFWITCEHQLASWREMAEPGKPLFRSPNVTEVDDLETSEIESMCMSCGEMVGRQFVR